MAYVDLKGIQVGVIYLSLWGVAVGILTYFVIGFFVFFMLRKYDLNRKPIILLVMLSALGHFFGGILGYWSALHLGADSDFYFQNASTNGGGVGYFFAFLFLGYLKKMFVGESFLGAYLFFSAVGFLGSVLL